MSDEKVGTHIVNDSRELNQIMPLLCREPDILHETIPDVVLYLTLPDSWRDSILHHTPDHNKDRILAIERKKLEILPFFYGDLDEDRFPSPDQKEKNFTFSDNRFHHAHGFMHPVPKSKVTSHGGNGDKKKRKAQRIERRKQRHH